MILKAKLYDLNLKHTFSIAHGSRKTTPIVLIQLKHENKVGYGEASLPPYLVEKQETVLDFFNKIDLKKFYNPVLQYEQILNYIDQVDDGNFAAKAAIDIAIHDLVGKITKTPCWKMIGSSPLSMPINSFTIGIDEEDIIVKKIDEAASFELLKVKLGTGNDKSLIDTIRKHTEKPFYVDVNQGWNDVYYAEEMSRWLKDRGAILLEQPMQKDNLGAHSRLKEKNILPIFADESFQNARDLEKIKDSFDGINIKLMKCGGIKAALEIILQAKKLNLKILMGCMNESSCATLAAASIAPLCDYADLDGPSLINNNPFEDYIMKNGKIILSNKPGLGLKKQSRIN